ncbi:MAG: hypothetical protein RLZZ41_696, partial [Actinomycetota bacterium]
IPVVTVTWLSCQTDSNTDYSDCLSIPGGSGWVYTPTSADVSRYLTARITAQNELGSVIVYAVKRQVGVPPRMISPATISGPVTTNGILQESQGVWEGWPAPRTYIRWFACDTALVEPQLALPADCQPLPWSETHDINRTVQLTNSQLGKYIMIREGVRNYSGEIEYYSPTVGPVTNP